MHEIVTSRGRQAIEVTCCGSASAGVKICLANLAKDQNFL